MCQGINVSWTSAAYTGSAMSAHDNAIGKTTKKWNYTHREEHEHIIKITINNGTTRR